MTKLRNEQPENERQMAVIASRLRMAIAELNLSQTGFVAIAKTQGYLYLDRNRIGILCRGGRMFAYEIYDICRLTNKPPEWFNPYLEITTNESNLESAQNRQH